MRISTKNKRNLKSAYDIVLSEHANKIQKAKTVTKKQFSKPKNIKSSVCLLRPDDFNVGVFS